MRVGTATLRVGKGVVVGADGVADAGDTCAGFADRDAASVLQTPVESLLVRAHGVGRRGA